MTLSYDARGNRLTKQDSLGTTGHQYNLANELTLTTPPHGAPTTSSYGPSGNLALEVTGSARTTMTCDGENRCLNELRGSGAHHTYTYAPDGLRRGMHQGGSANPVTFVWDGDDLLNDYMSGGVSVRYDVLDGEVLGHKGGANRYLYVPDPLGSVVNLLDTSQNTAGTYVYAPYGEVLSHTGANTAMQFVGALGYQTQITNRAYVRARYYRADLGRWQARALPPAPCDEGTRAVARRRAHHATQGLGAASSAELLPDTPRSLRGWSPSRTVTGAWPGPPALWPCLPLLCLARCEAILDNMIDDCPNRAYDYLWRLRPPNGWSSEEEERKALELARGMLELCEKVARMSFCWCLWLKCGDTGGKLAPGSCGPMPRYRSRPSPIHPRFGVPVLPPPGYCVVC